ncbi:hypothetical protein CC80DRAFT_562290 [Byssothecium circinans]|uniref:Uncharacterized protein n=1 Tax=Byssothecium circinans TaxID=147558 RepID=A0A6A5TW65_9PLEO|nr:hypothetical protein CC80DRAFT_562290 [Byssothecium circinans]
MTKNKPHAQKTHHQTTPKAAEVLTIPPPRPNARPLIIHSSPIMGDIHSHNPSHTHNIEFNLPDRFDPTSTLTSTPPTSGPCNSALLMNCQYRIALGTYLCVGSVQGKPWACFESDEAFYNACAEVALRRASGLVERMDAAGVSSLYASASSRGPTPAPVSAHVRVPFSVPWTTENASVPDTPFVHDCHVDGPESLNPTTLLPPPPNPGSLPSPQPTSSNHTPPSPAMGPQQNTTDPEAFYLLYPPGSSPEVVYLLFPPSSVPFPGYPSKCYNNTPPPPATGPQHSTALETSYTVLPPSPQRGTSGQSTRPDSDPRYTFKLARAALQQHVGVRPTRLEKISMEGVEVPNRFGVMSASSMSFGSSLLSSEEDENEAYEGDGDEDTNEDSDEEEESDDEVASDEDDNEQDSDGSTDQENSDLYSLSDQGAYDTDHEEDENDYEDGTHEASYLSTTAYPNNNISPPSLTHRKTLLQLAKLKHELAIQALDLRLKNEKLDKTIAETRKIEAELMTRYGIDLHRERTMTAEAIREMEKMKAWEARERKEWSCKVYDMLFVALVLCCINLVLKVSREGR